MARVSEPIAPWIATRSALLTRTFFKAEALSAGIVAPVLALKIVPVGGLVGDDVIGGVDQQPIVAERIQDRRGLRWGLGGELADRLLALGKLVVEKLRQRVVERVGAGDSGDDETRKEREDAQREREGVRSSGAYQASSAFRDIDTNPV